MGPWLLKIAILIYTVWQHEKLVLGHDDSDSLLLKGWFKSYGGNHIVPAYMIASRPIAVEMNCWENTQSKKCIDNQRT